MNGPNVKLGTKCPSITSKCSRFTPNLSTNLISSFNFVKLAESFKAKGLRAKKVDELDDVIKEMISSEETVIADIWIKKEENCFPMIQSGSAHNEMLLNKEQKQDKKSAEKGKVLV